MKLVAIGTCLALLYAAYGMIVLSRHDEMHFASVFMGG